LESFLSQEDSTTIFLYGAKSALDKLRLLSLAKENNLSDTSLS
jgi:hypothetical protein